MADDGSLTAGPSTATIDAAHAFEGPNAKEALVELFETRSQLVVDHFMFGADSRRLGSTPAVLPGDESISSCTCAPAASPRSTRRRGVPPSA